MISERALRDDLERLQVETRALEAELLAEHGPAFLERRERVTQELAATRSALADLERALLTATAEETATRARVDRLADELHALEQRRLSAVPFVLLPLAALGVWKALGPELPIGPTAFACALSLGYLFGPRVLDWARPGQRREPLAPTLTRSFIDDVWRNHGLVALGLSGVAGLIALVLGTGFWRAVQLSGGFRWARFEEEEHFLFSLPLQLIVVATVLLALRALRRVQERGGSGRRTAIAAVVLALGALLISAMTWGPDLLDQLTDYRKTLPLSLRLYDAAFSLSSFAALPPLGLALLAQWATQTRRVWLLLASTAFSILSLLATAALWAQPHLTSVPMRELAGVLNGLLFSGGALLLGLDFARSSQAPAPAWRWVGVAMAGVAMAASLLLFALR